MTTTMTKDEGLALHFHSRREFCALACQAASVLAAGALAACGGSPTSPSRQRLTLLSVSPPNGAEMYAKYSTNNRRLTDV